MRTVFLVAILASIVSAQSDPGLRLPQTVRPERYEGELTIDPAKPKFQGKIRISLRLDAPTSTVWLHGADLTIRGAKLAGQPASFARGANGKLSFSVRKPVPAGKSILEIGYDGTISDKASAGLFRFKVGEEWYVYSQFEPIDARRAFPCFDEPVFKAPWQFTLKVPRAATALSNTPGTEQAGTDGWKTMKFEPTAPIPSYLVAFAVGPFDVVDAGRAGKNKIPLRIVTPKGMAEQAKYAAGVTGIILERLEEYFGSPYPYQKLDSVAIPLTLGFGAMENVGLITYVQGLILSDPARESIDFQRSYASVAAHEIAHQWFGNYVTLKWWDDIWLNEAFATWMERKIIAEWKPDWSTRLEDVIETSNATAGDTLKSSRQIRQPIEAQGDILNAFDGITYQKGASVIGMFEQWVGPEQFQKGVQRYMQRYAFKTTTAGDFLDSISVASRPELTAAFTTFLNQPGIPLISTKLECSGGSARLSLQQERAIPAGSSADAKKSWQVPVCIRYSVGGKVQSECMLLTAPSMEWKLQANGCPDWVVANESARGYYRVQYDADMRRKLLAAKPFTDVEMVSFLQDTRALARMGKLPYEDALQTAARFAGHARREVTESAIGVATGPYPELVPPRLYDAYSTYFQHTFGAMGEKLGWKPGANDSADTKLLRQEVVEAVAKFGRSEPLVREAKRLARAWLRDPSAVSPDLVEGVLTTASRFGDEQWWKELVAALKGTQDRRRRGDLIRALAAFSSPDLVSRSLDLLLTGEIDFREAAPLWFGPAQRPATVTTAFDWLKAHWDRLLPKLPVAVGFEPVAQLTAVGSGFCSAEQRDQLERFFGPLQAKYPGVKRPLAQRLESIDLCVQLKSVQEPSVARFLEGQASPNSNR